MRKFFGILLIFFTASAAAQTFKFADLKQKGAAQIPIDDLRKLAAGAAVTDQASTGSTRKWENAADGTLSATTNNAGGSSATAGGRARSLQGKGTWKVDDKGRYCVTIAWPTAEEKWCAFIFRVGDKTYRSNGGADANAWEIEFKR